MFMATLILIQFNSFTPILPNMMLLFTNIYSGPAHEHTVLRKARKHNVEGRGNES
jgi:hypothetical protein